MPKPTQTKKVLTLPESLYSQFKDIAKSAGITHLVMNTSIPEKNPNPDDVYVRISIHIGEYGPCR